MQKTILTTFFESLLIWGSIGSPLKRKLMVFFGISSISQNLRSGRWSTTTSALRQTWSQTASLQQLQQSRGQLWERCFDIVNITNPPRRLRKLSLHQFSIFPSAGGVGGNPCQQNEEKISWCSTKMPDLLTFSPS